MRYCITRRAANPVFTVGHRFVITDDAGALRYRVDDRLRGVAASAVLRDAAGAPLLTLEIRHQSLGPGVHLLRGTEVAGSVQVQRDLTIAGPELQIRAPDDLELVGSLARHEYTLTRRDRVLVHVSRRWCPQRRHTYGADVVPSEDEPLLLAVVLALDMLFQYT